MPNSKGRAGSSPNRADLSRIPGAIITDTYCYAEGEELFVDADGVFTADFNEVASKNFLQRAIVPYPCGMKMKVDKRPNENQNICIVNLTGADFTPLVGIHGVKRQSKMLTDQQIQASLASKHPLRHGQTLLVNCNSENYLLGINGDTLLGSDNATVSLKDICATHLQVDSVNGNLRASYVDKNVRMSKSKTYLTNNTTAPFSTCLIPLDHRVPAAVIDEQNRSGLICATDVSIDGCNEVKPGFTLEVNIPDTKFDVEIAENFYAANSNAYNDQIDFRTDYQTSAVTTITLGQAVVFTKLNNNEIQSIVINMSKLQYIEQILVNTMGQL